MIDQQLAEVSNLAIVVSIVLYVLALFGFSADLARSSQLRGDERLAARERELAGVGARAASVGAAADGHAAESAVTASAPVGGSADDLLGGASRSGASDAPGASSAGSRGMTPQRFGFILAAVAAGLHALGVVLRGVATQRPPWTNMYEFAMTSAAAVMVVFLVLCLRRLDLRSLAVFVLGPMLLLMLVAQTFWIVPAAELTPSLQNSHWLVIHIGVAIIATALSILGAVVVGLQLSAARHEKAQRERALRGDATVESAAGLVEAEARSSKNGAGRVEGLRGHWGRFGRILDRLPDSVKLEGLSFRIHAIGFVCWTFTLIFGAIWAREAWGRPWGWDPKEVWTFVIWVVYAAYLHARSTGGFRGTRAAWLALAGFLCVVFNYTIVNTVINGFHSYSGL